MSLETWKAEFYPVRAADCPRGEAVMHSIRKWGGFRPSALKQHGLEWKEIYGLRGEGSCALCHHYCDALSGCGWCPAFKVRGRKCFEPRGSSPYSEALDHHDVGPMLRLLRDAWELEQRDAKPEPLPEPPPPPVFKVATCFEVRVDFPKKYKMGPDPTADSYLYDVGLAVRATLQGAEGSLKAGLEDRGFKLIEFSVSPGKPVGQGDDDNPGAHKE